MAERSRNRQMDFRFYLVTWVILLTLSWGRESFADASLNCQVAYEKLALTGARQLPAPVASLQGASLTTTTDIERALGTLDQVRPRVDAGVRGFFNPCSGLGLGYFGQLGPYGPLSRLGPNGRNVWNPATAISSCNWSPWAALLTQWGGALSSLGPLGRYGSTGTMAYRDLLPFLGPYGKHLQEDGVLAILGPKGPLGPEGPLGPLSAIGATGHAVDPLTGEFRNGRRIIHDVQVRDGDRVRSYQLEETYSAAQTQKLSRKRTLDASFLVDEQMGAENIHEFNIQVKGGTLSSFVVSPSIHLDRFSIELLAEDGSRLAQSNSRDLINFIQLNARQDARVRVRIRYEGSSSYDPFASAPRGSRNPGYRFIASQAHSESDDLGFDGPYLTRFH